MINVTRELKEYSDQWGTNRTLLVQSHNTPNDRVSLSIRRDAGPPTDRRHRHRPYRGSA